MNHSTKNNSNEEINQSKLFDNSDSEEKTSIDFLLSLVLRRKKFFISALIIFTSFTLIRTTKEKIYNPIFKGEFSILVSDPIKQVSGGAPIAGDKGIAQAASVFIILDVLFVIMYCYPFQKYRLYKQNLTYQLNHQRHFLLQMIYLHQLTYQMPLLKIQQ